MSICHLNLASIIFSEISTTSHFLLISLFHVIFANIIATRHLFMITQFHVSDQMSISHHRMFISPQSIYIMHDFFLSYLFYFAYNISTLISSSSRPATSIPPHVWTHHHLFILFLTILPSVFVQCLHSTSSNLFISNLVIRLTLFCHIGHVQCSIQLDCG